MKRSGRIAMLAVGALAGDAAAQECSHDCPRAQRDAQNCCPQRASARPPAQAPGSIYVTANVDGAAILIDGAPRGATPRRIDGLTPGNHALELRAEGRAAESRIVNVRSGGMRAVSVALAPASPAASGAPSTASAPAAPASANVPAAPSPATENSAPVAALAYTFSGYNYTGFIEFTRRAADPVYVARANGDGTFQRAASGGLRGFAPAGETPLVGEINGDAQADLIVLTHRAADSVYIAFGNGDGTFRPQQNTGITGLADPQLTGAMGDADGDGDGDLLFITHRAADPFYVSFGNRDGTFQPPVNTQITGIAGPGETVLYGSVDVDGHPDIVVFTHRAADSVYVIPSNMNGTFRPPINTGLLGFGGADETALIGDINSDFRADLVVFTHRAADPVYIARNQGNGTFARQSAVGLTGLAGPGETPLVADLNNDGAAELIVLTHRAADPVYVAMNNGDGTFRPQRDSGLTGFMAERR